MAALATTANDTTSAVDVQLQHAASANEHNKLISRGLEHREHFDCQELMDKYPPQYKDARKKALFASIASNGSVVCPGTLTYARYKKVDLPPTFADPTDFIEKRVRLKPGVFEYHSHTEDAAKLHFYVNFADVNLFGFYKGSCPRSSLLM